MVCRRVGQTGRSGGQGGRRIDFLEKETLQDEMDSDVQCSNGTGRDDGFGSGRAVRIRRMQKLWLRRRLPARMLQTNDCSSVPHECVHVPAKVFRH